jgi:DNA-binding transcriptional MerR regulator
MTDEPLLTLRQVADELGLPESTVRYYRDAFLDHVPSVGTGRRRRYPPAAVAVLRSVAEGYASGRSREQMLRAMEGTAAEPARVGALDEKAARAHRPPAGISNLELLAAIVDGEREQRDALWQMAKEIVRLTDVLEGQEKVLTEIADHAGVSVQMPPALQAGVSPPTRALGEGRAPVADAPTPPLPPAPTVPFVAPAWTPPQPAAPPDVVPVPEAAADDAPPMAPEPPPFGEPPAAVTSGVEMPPAVVEAGSLGGVAGAAEAGVAHSEMERLRAELEMERQLVERLRESKVKLEHRVSNAEAELEERRPRKRSSVLGRILNPGENE